jgi:hypothetical protein
MNQLIKQSNSIGKLITNVPSRNVAIYDASKNELKFKDYKTNTLMNTIVEVVGAWAYDLGVSDKVNDKDIILNSKFIQENFSELNITDLKEAIKMFLTNELNTKEPIKLYYGFAPLFIGQVLSAYRNNRSEIIVDVNKKLLNLKAKEVSKEPSLVERVITLQIIIKNAWTDVVLNKKYYEDYGDVIYNYLRKYKHIDNTNRNLIERAKEYATKKLNKDRRFKSEISAIKDVPFIKGDEAFEYRQNGRQYMISDWLRTKDDKQIEIFIKQIDKI